MVGLALPILSLVVPPLKIHHGRPVWDLGSVVGAEGRGPSREEEVVWLREDGIEHRLHRRHGVNSLEKERMVGFSGMHTLLAGLALLAEKDLLGSPLRLLGLSFILVVGGWGVPSGFLVGLNVVSHVLCQ